MPSNFSATAISASSVSVTWSPSTGATSYELRRKSGGEAFATIVTQAATSFTDMDLTADTAYIYQVRARNGTAPNRFFSTYTLPNAATTINFSDDPIQSQQTLIRKAHVDELRTAANALRSAVGMPASSFAEPLTAGVTTVRVSHITELRAAMEAAFSTLGVSLSYAHSTLTPETSVISVVDIQELRNALK